jgi:hypothetical protein
MNWENGKEADVSLELYWRCKRKAVIKSDIITGVPDEIRTQHLPNTSL